MIPREIIDELGEALGTCDETLLLRRINRAVELLANKGLFDPLIGYLNFNVDEGNFIALPREVRTVLAVNLNNQPAFARSRFYEFDLNTPGTQTGDSLEYEWADRVNVCVQDERKLPGQMAYRALQVADNGKKCTIEGRNAAGRVISETIVASSTSPVSSTNTFHEISRIFREATTGECLLNTGGELVAQYYPDETSPVYRCIRLARAVASVRIMFRREPLKITNLDSFIPLNSPMAVIQAAKAVGHLTAGEDAMADACLARAEMFIKEDQASREEGDKIAAQRQTPGTLGVGLLHSEGITVLDVYDPASEIFGNIGRNPVFKKITQALQTLLNKAHWDGMIGACDIYPRSQKEEINPRGGHGHGYYTLPRFMGTPLSITICGEPLKGRNQWFDFHLNGSGERNTASFRSWDDLGETPIIDFLELEAGTGYVIPRKVVAICENALDEGKFIMIFGKEKRGDGTVVEVWRDGKPGWRCPCLSALADPGETAPLWVEIERIQRAETRGFVRLQAMRGTYTPGTPPADITTITTGYSLAGVWSGASMGARVYARVEGADTVVYGDADLTIEVGRSTLTTNPVVAATNEPIVFSVNGVNFTGTWQKAATPTGTFTITRTVTAAIPGSWSLTATRLLGFWYPDEVEPSYRLIRLPTSHPKRIRILYRKHFKRICSLFDVIPLRSSLAVENMFRAIKAYELGMVEQAMPLEEIAVKHLGEDRIKAGPSEMPTLQFDNDTGPGGWENIT